MPRLEAILDKKQLGYQSGSLKIVALTDVLGAATSKNRSPHRIGSIFWDT